MKTREKIMGILFPIAIAATVAIYALTGASLTMTVITTAAMLCVLLVSVLPASSETGTFDITRILLVMNTASVFWLAKDEPLPNATLVIGISAVLLVAFYKGYRVWRHALLNKRHRGIFIADASLLTLLMVCHAYFMAFLDADDWLSILAVINFGLVSYFTFLTYKPKPNEFRLVIDKNHPTITVETGE